MSIILVYDDASEAADDVEVLRHRILTGRSLVDDCTWQEVIDSSRVWSDGNTLQAIFRGEIVQDWYAIYYTRDTLLQRK